MQKLWKFFFFSATLWNLLINHSSYLIWLQNNKEMLLFATAFFTLSSQNWNPDGHLEVQNSTDVKWGHTEGIEREKTLSQKYTIIALNFWRDEFFLVFQIWGKNTIGGQYLQNINALIFWYKYLQKANAMPSDFWWKENTSFAPLMNIL